MADKAIEVFSEYTEELTNQHGVTTIKSRSKVLDSETTEAILRFYKEGLLDENEAGKYQSWINELTDTAGLSNTPYVVDDKLVIRLNPVVIDGEKIYLVIKICHITRLNTIPEDCVKIGGRRPRVVISRNWDSRMVLDVRGSQIEYKGPTTEYCRNLFSWFRTLTEMCVGGDPLSTDIRYICADSADYSGIAPFSRLNKNVGDDIYYEFSTRFPNKQAKLVLIMFDRDSGELNIIHNASEKPQDVLGGIAHYFNLNKVSLANTVEESTLVHKVAYVNEDSPTKKELTPTKEELPQNETNKVYKLIYVNSSGAIVKDFGVVDISTWNTSSAWKVAQNFARANDSKLGRLVLRRYEYVADQELPVFGKLVLVDDVVNKVSTFESDLGPSKPAMGQFKLISGFLRDVLGWVSNVDDPSGNLLFVDGTGLSRIVVVVQNKDGKRSDATPLTNSEVSAIALHLGASPTMIRPTSCFNCHDRMVVLLKNINPEQKTDGYLS